MDAAKYKAMVTDIVQTMKAGGAVITGETFFMLAFRTEGELREIISELHKRGNV